MAGELVRVRTPRALTVNVPELQGEEYNVYVLDARNRYTRDALAIRLVCQERRYSQVVTYIGMVFVAAKTRRLGYGTLQ